MQTATLFTDVAFLRIFKKYYHMRTATLSVDFIFLWIFLKYDVHTATLFTGISCLWIFQKYYNIQQFFFFSLMSLACGFFKSMTCTQAHSNNFYDVTCLWIFQKYYDIQKAFFFKHCIYWCHFLVDFSKVLWHANSNTFYRSLSCGFLFFLSIRIVCKQQHFFESIMTCKQHLFYFLLLIPLSCGF